MDTEEEYRYLFLVRQGFQEDPIVDSFYKVTIMPGITGEQALLMSKLQDGFQDEEALADKQAMFGMQMRLRFNRDMYQHVCLVTTGFEMTAEELENVVQMKSKDGELVEWLDGAAVA